MDVERVTGRQPMGWGVSDQTPSIMTSMGMACDAGAMERDVPHMMDTRAGTLARFSGTETITHDRTPVCRMFSHRGVVV